MFHFKLDGLMGLPYRQQELNTTVPEFSRKGTAKK
jgi:hypothetical protein